MPFMPLDLRRVLKSQAIDDEQIQIFAYQILRGLKVSLALGLVSLTCWAQISNKLPIVNRV